MDKKGYKSNKDNIVLFPNVENRLLEKGLEHLQRKEFDEAAILLEQAIEFAPNKREAYTGLILAYYESGKYTLAKKIGKQLFEKTNGDYEILELYIMILIQLHEYEEIIHLLETSAYNHKIPEEKRDSFRKLLNLSEKMVRQKEEAQNEKASNLKGHLHLFNETDLNKLVMKVSELTYRNVRPHLDEVKEYLISKKGHPFIKTMLLSILKEQDYNKEITIEKFNKELTVKPIELPRLEDYKDNTSMIKYLTHIENDNPLLYQHTLALIERHLFILYPFNWFINEGKVWGAAYHYLTEQYLGMDVTIEDIQEKYDVSPTLLEEACQFLRKLEEISYPII